MNRVLVGMFFALTLAAPHALCAQSQPVPLLAHTRSTIGARAIVVGRTTPFDITTSSTRASRAKRGAIIGAAVVGIAAGSLAYAANPVGCDASLPAKPCNPQHNRVLFAVGYGGLGAVAGAITGGTIGALMPSRTTNAPASR